MYFEPKCSRVVQPSKYERNAPETANWWHKLFNLMEAEAAIPFDKRKEVLKQVFPEKVLDKILSILTVAEDVQHLLPPDTDLKKQQNNICLSLRNSTTTFFEEDAKQRREMGPNNPYLKFFKRRPDRAAIWRPLPPLSLSEMNLTQKAEALTETVAMEFVEWMKSITDEDEAPSTLTVQKILKMFEIGFNTHAAKSLQVRMKEMAAVPDAVASLAGLHHMSKRNQLHRQIRRDVAACKKKRKLFAFGTKLPRELQVYALAKDATHKWLVCDRVPADLETMSTVWQGITHLKSTRSYCEYLLEHPEIKPPKFLEENRMLDPVVLHGPHYSIETQTDTTPLLTVPANIADDKPPPSLNILPMGVYNEGSLKAASGAGTDPTDNDV